jgi:hypothetical protein
VKKAKISTRSGAPQITSIVGQTLRELERHASKAPNSPLRCRMSRSVARAQEEILSPWALHCSMEPYVAHWHSENPGELREYPLRFIDTCLIFASAVGFVVACGGGTTVERETVTPVAVPVQPVQPVQTEPAVAPAPPPGGKTEVKTEDAEGNESKVEVKQK